MPAVLYARLFVQNICVNSPEIMMSPQLKRMRIHDVNTQFKVWDSSGTNFIVLVAINILKPESIILEQKKLFAMKGVFIFIHE